MPFDPQPIVRSFRRIFATSGSTTRAAGEKKYLKSDLQFYGVPKPVIRKTVKEYCARHPDMSHDSLVALVTACWETDCHELRSTAIGLLEYQHALLGLKDMALVERLVRQSETWAYVDWLAVTIAGRIVLEHATARRVLARWARDPYMWLRRSSMLALLPSLKRDGTDFPLFSRFASAMVTEREFFIRKAIGWVLREVGKKRPLETFNFLRQHVSVVSGLTLREGGKYLPAAQRKTLKALYEARGS